MQQSLHHGRISFFITALWYRFITVVRQGDNRISLQRLFHHDPPFYKRSLNSLFEIATSFFALIADAQRWLHCDASRKSFPIIRTIPCWQISHKSHARNFLRHSSRLVRQAAHGIHTTIAQRSTGWQNPHSVQRRTRGPPFHRLGTLFVISSPK